MPVVDHSSLLPFRSPHSASPLGLPLTQQLTFPHPKIAHYPLFFPGEIWSIAWSTPTNDTVDFREGDSVGSDVNDRNLRLLM